MTAVVAVIPLNFCLTRRGLLRSTGGRDYDGVAFVALVADDGGACGAAREREELAPEVVLDCDGAAGTDVDARERRVVVLDAVRRSGFGLALLAGPFHVAGLGARGYEPVVARSVVAARLELYADAVFELKP